jgi:hypothetical protein
MAQASRSDSEFRTPLGFDRYNPLLVPSLVLLLLYAKQPIDIFSGGNSRPDCEVRCLSLSS